MSPQYLSSRMTNIMLKAIHILAPIFIFILAGCSSTPRYNLNVPLSEAANAAASNSSIDNNIAATPSFSNHDSNSYIQGSFEVVSNPFYYDNDMNFATLDSRISFYRTLPINLSNKGYSLAPGMQLSLAGRDNTIQYRLSLGYTPGVFSTPNNKGLHDLHLFEISGDLSAIKKISSNMVFEIGGRAGIGIASFAFATPLYLYGDEIRGDGLSTFFIAAPIGIQLDLGVFTIETQVSPTLSFHDSETEVGFDNDIVFAKWTLPLVYGLGINF